MTAATIGSVCEVENIPAEMEGFRGDVEKDKIGHSLVEQPVNGIADSAADDQAERNSSKSRADAASQTQSSTTATILRVSNVHFPDPREQAVADPLVPNQDKIQEGRQPHGGAGAEVEDVDRAKASRLARLRHSLKRPQGPIA